MRKLACKKRKLLGKVGGSQPTGTMPQAVFTFLESADFAGKKILPFCTHEGSGMGRSEADIKKLCPTATVAKGLAINGSSCNSAEPSVKKWLSANGIL